MNALLGSCYAAARKHLAEARKAQLEALFFGLGVYRGGRLGRDARFFRDRHDQHRREHLERALTIRARIRELRAELRQLENQNTEPPRAA